MTAPDGADRELDASAAQALVDFVGWLWRVPKANHDTNERYKEKLERAGFKTEVVGDVRGLVWGKLAINAAINPLAALTITDWVRASGTAMTRARFLIRAAWPAASRPWPRRARCWWTAPTPRSCCT